MVGVGVVKGLVVLVDCGCVECGYVGIVIEDGGD